MADSKDQTWDDLYTETAVPDVIPPPSEDDPINDIQPAAATPEELEEAAARERVEEVDPIPEVPTDPNAGEVDPAADPAASPTADPTPETAAEDLEKMTGIERYLSQFDIEGGVVSLEDGTSKHFTELTAEQQSNVLSQLHEANASTIEDKFGLVEEEIGLINYLRSNKLTVNGMIDKMASERVNTLMVMQNMETTDYEKVADDDIYLQYLKRRNPEITAETLESDLVKAKDLSSYKSLVDSIRQDYITEQANLIKDKLESESTQQVGLIEEQRAEVVNAISGINDIAGINLNDGIKNGILDKVLEVNEYGDSKFMEEVFGEPQKLFNAAFWYYYGPSILDQRDTYWKQQKSASYKRGREEALGNNPTRISFGSGTKPDQTPKHAAQAVDDDDWLSLHT